MDTLGPPTTEPQDKVLQCLFFSLLPREIRDEIYAYAFQRDSETMKIFSKTEWERRHETANLGWPSFPGCPLSNMVVSKQFYTEAVPTFLHKGTTLRLDNVIEFDRFVDCTKTSPLLPSLRTVHINNLEFEYGFRSLSNLQYCTHLRRLLVTPTRFCNWKYFSEDLDARYFKHLRSIKYLVAAKSLRSVTVLATTRSSIANLYTLHHRLTFVEGRQLQKNLAAMSDFITSKLKGNDGHDNDHDDNDGVLERDGILLNDYSEQTNISTPSTRIPLNRSCKRIKFA